MKLQRGQYKDTVKAFGDVNIRDCSIVAEGGSDNGETFHGSFLVEIKRKGTYRFEDGLLLKKIK
jgi:hypothetical protein